MRKRGGNRKRKKDRQRANESHSEQGKQKVREKEREMSKFTRGSLELQVDGVWEQFESTRECQGRSWLIQRGESDESQKQHGNVREKGMKFDENSSCFPHTEAKYSLRMVKLREKQRKGNGERNQEKERETEREA